MGLRLRELGTRNLSWSDLWAVIQYPASGSPLEMAITSRWRVQEELLALATEQLSSANWQRSGGKGGRPKKLPRPYETKDTGERTYGKDPIPASTFETWWEEAK